MSLSPRTKSSNSLRVLMQTRPNVFTQRGGDTIVLERLSQGLQQCGIDVTVDPTGATTPRGFDLVHLFNFATPGITGPQAQRAMDAGVPYVVTTLYEDSPQFHTQSHYIAAKLINYVEAGQHSDSWQVSYRELAAITPSGHFPADAIALHAAALIANGSGEARALKRDFPDSKLIECVPLGSEVGAFEGPELFESTYGVRDFVFCVGRLESRKNQLMLLKALEDSELTVVLAGGGFSYQPEYDQAIRAFKRKGQTIVLGQIDSRMLSSAYAASRIHVLPSWYELPGLVTLEAAAHGKNIVVTRTGTTADYVGELGYYCLPWECDSIRSAIMAAYHAPVCEELVNMSKSYSWDKSVEKTVEVYKKVVGRSNWLSKDDDGAAGRCAVRVPHGEYDMSLDAMQFLDILERGEAAAKSADFETANEFLLQAEAMQPYSTRVLRALGAVLLAQSKADEARVIFDRGLRCDAIDPKLLAGRGMCDLLQQRPQTALPYFEKSLAIAPDYLVALHQLLECSYGLCQYDTAVAALRKYLTIKPDDTDIRFCLAGCLFKAGQKEDADKELAVILASSPTHVGALELRNIMNAGVDGRDSAETAMAPSAAPRVVSGVTPSDLRSSLAELSNKVRGWQVGKPSTPVVAAPAVSQVSTSAEDAAQAAAEFGTAIGRIEDLKRSGDFGAATKALQELLDRKDVPQPYRERAECLQAEFTVLGGDLKKSAEMYDVILAQNPRSARALCGKGAIAAELGEWATAQAYFENAQGCDSTCDVAFAGLGLCAMVANQIDKAFGLFSEAVAKNPENNRALLGVLQTGYPLQKYTEMERMLTAFLDLHPANLDILYSFAGVLFAQGKVREARIEVEKILLFAPEHEHAVELKGIIDQSEQQAPQMQ